MAGVHVLRRCAWRLARIASIPVILAPGGVRLPSPIDPVTRRPMHRAIRPCAIIVRVVPMQMHRQQRSTGDRCPLMEAAILNPLLGVCSSSRGRRRVMLSLLSSPSLLSWNHDSGDKLRWRRMHRPPNLRAVGAPPLSRNTFTGDLRLPSNICAGEFPWVSNGQFKN